MHRRTSVEDTSGVSAEIRTIRVGPAEAASRAAASDASIMRDTRAGTRARTAAVDVPDWATTAKCAASSTAGYSCHEAMSTNASPPSTKNSSTGAQPFPCRRASVAEVNDGPSAHSSSSSAWNPSQPATASATMANRWNGDARGGSWRCSGVRDGMKRTVSRRSARRATAAASRWPTWIGSKVPPSMPIRRVMASWAVRRVSGPGAPVRPLRRRARPLRRGVPRR